MSSLTKRPKMLKGDLGSKIVSVAILNTIITLKPNANSDMNKTSQSTVGAITDTVRKEKPLLNKENARPVSKKLGKPPTSSGVTRMRPTVPLFYVLRIEVYYENTVHQTRQ